jgi:hypothetical protein
MSVFEKTSALKLADGDTVCAGVVAVNASNIGKSQSTVQEYLMREAWRARAAIQGFSLPTVWLGAR